MLEESSLGAIDNIDILGKMEIKRASVNYYRVYFIFLN
jgi:hypothetical protein